jgi:hypothetical protein
LVGQLFNGIGKDRIVKFAMVLMFSTFARTKSRVAVIGNCPDLLPNYKFCPRVKVHLRKKSFDESRPAILSEGIHGRVFLEARATLSSMASAVQGATRYVVH